MKDIYIERIKRLKKKKIQQTKDKIELEGLLDEDDYGRVVPPKNHWNIIPNHEDGSFYGFQAWTDNFCSLMENHPVYEDEDDAFSGRWMYFLSKMRPNKWNPDYPYDHLIDNINKYNIKSGIGDDAHFAPDYTIGIELGWGGLLKKIEHFRTINTSPDNKLFYDIHERAIKAVQDWIMNHIHELKRLAETESDNEKKNMLLEKAIINENVLHEPPKTFREVLQWIIWFHLASRTYNRDGAGGQLDTLIQPFYENDIKLGRISNDEAIYYLACFLINDPIYWQLGGPDEKGVDQTSEISFLILEAADLIDTSLNITIRYHDGLNPELFNKGIEYLIKNKNAWPRFSGDKALVDGFMKNGFSVEMARQRIAVGCNWMSLPGKEYTMNDLVKINLAKVFEISLFDMMNNKDITKSVKNLWNIFLTHMAEAVNTTANGIRHHLKYQKYNEPELLLNLLSHGPLEKGLDVSDGGAMFYNLAIDGAGLAIVADSFAALEQRIEMEGRTTWDELIYHINGDFEGDEGENFRMLLWNSEKYGQGNSIGDKWADLIKEKFVQHVLSESDEKKKHHFIPGFFSWANTMEFGEAVMATPNGRQAHTPISHGANPVPGFSIDGASLALSNAIARIQPGYGNTAPMQWELDPSFSGDENASVIGSIIKGHFNLGGTLINVNILDKNVILEAHKDPSKYPELVVRITGFTAYFSMLTPEFRQLVVDRILNN